MVTPTLERLDEIFDRASRLRLAVIGDLMLDEYISGDVSRISPEAPVPVVRVTDHRVALGGAANVAANVTALGASCDLVGFLGADAAGEKLKGALRERCGEGIRAHLVERADRPTTTKTRIMARRQQVVRFDRENDDDLPQDAIDELLERIGGVIPHVDAVILEDYNKGVLVPAVIRAALDGARSAGVPSVVDPKFRRFFEYRGATVFKPNVIELGTALTEPVRPDDDDQLERARERTGCDHLLLTLGEDGIVLRSGGGATYRARAVAREVYDVSGAGDTVTAYVAAMLAAGASVAEAAAIANFAAAVEVGKPGVAAVGPHEVRALVQEIRFHDLSRA
jgi:rfaE bifunctional protein kinase chain/domain